MWRSNCVKGSVLVVALPEQIIENRGLCVGAEIASSFEVKVPVQFIELVKIFFANKMIISIVRFSV